MSSLSRLLKLARRSYGPVFVYDAEMEEDYVLMSTDEYFSDEYASEDDVLEEWYDFERSHVMNAAEDALYDQEDGSEESLFDQRITSMYDPEFENIQMSSPDDVPPPPVHDDAWHTPASVFESYSPMHTPIDMPPHDSYVAHDALRGLRPAEPESLNWEDDGSWEPTFEMPVEPIPNTAQPVRFEPVPFDPPLDTSRLESEPLPDSDAPVFYEEPVV